jgi:hypothetical protein
MIPRRFASLFPILALPVILSLAGCNALKSIAILPTAGTVVLTAVGQTAQYSASGQSQMGTGLLTTSNVTGLGDLVGDQPQCRDHQLRRARDRIGCRLHPGHRRVQRNHRNLRPDGKSPRDHHHRSRVKCLWACNHSRQSDSRFARQTSQFIAIGTASSGATVDLTNQVVWNSSSTADRHHRRQLRAGHRRRSGSRHHYRSLHQRHNRNRGGRHSDVQRARRDHREVHRE